MLPAMRELVQFPEKYSAAIDGIAVKAGDEEEKGQILVEFTYQEFQARPDPTCR